MPENPWDAAVYEANVGFVPAFGRGVVDVLAPQASERILDLGCGDGVLTQELVARAREVVGIDGSPDMVEAARGRGIDAHVVDASELPAVVGAPQLQRESFDAVFSNATLHWIPQADAVIAGVRDLLVTGGRFVGEFGGHGNVAAIVVALDASRRLHGFDSVGNPWFFPTIAEYEKRLRDGGFEVDAIALIPRPTLLPTGVNGWMRTFGGPYLSDLDDDSADAVVASAIDLLAGSLRDASGSWTADYVRLRFAAHKV